MANILVIEDDRSICEMINNYLTGEGFFVAAFYDGKAAIEDFLTDKEYDLALIDLMLPGMNGMDIIRRIRAVSTVPIIIITARDNDTDKSMGLNLGADDYVVKPFSLIELTARIKANIRRTSQYDRQQSFALLFTKSVPATIVSAILFFLLRQIIFASTDIYYDTPLEILLVLLITTSLLLYIFQRKIQG